MKTYICIIVLVIVISVGLILEGCSSQNPPIPVRDFFRANESPESGYGAYGYLLFTRRPDSSNLGRYKKVCMSFMGDLESVTEIGPYPKHSLMVTYWLVDSLVNLRRDSHNCDSLLAHYNYPKATIFLAQIKKLSVTGPVLLAFSSPPQTDSTLSDALVLDMSNFADEDIDMAFSIWKDRITRDPDGWNNGFTVNKLIYEFRSLINKYGQQILDIFKS